MANGTIDRTLTMWTSESVSRGGESRRFEVFGYGSTRPRRVSHPRRPWLVLCSAFRVAIASSPRCVVDLERIASRHAARVRGLLDWVKPRPARSSSQPRSQCPASTVLVLFMVATRTHGRGRGWTADEPGDRSHLPDRLHPLVRQALTGSGDIVPHDGFGTIASTPYQHSGPPPPSRSCASTSTPPRPATPAPTSSCATRSKPANEPTQIMTPCPEPWTPPRV